MSPAATPARRSASAIASPPSSYASSEASPPRNRPTGVRAPATMTLFASMPSGSFARLVLLILRGSAPLSRCGSRAHLAGGSARGRLHARHERLRDPPGTPHRERDAHQRGIHRRRRRDDTVAADEEILEAP